VKNIKTLDFIGFLLHYFVIDPVLITKPVF